MMTATEIINYLKEKGLRNSLTKPAFHYWRVYAKPKLSKKDYKLKHDKGRAYYVYNLNSILEKLNLKDQNNN